VRHEERALHHELALVFVRQLAVVADRLSEPVERRRHDALVLLVIDELVVAAFVLDVRVGGRKGRRGGNAQAVGAQIFPDEDGRVPAGELQPRHAHVEQLVPLALALALLPLPFAAIARWLPLVLHRVGSHPFVQALLEAAVLAPVSVVLRDLTVLASAAGVAEMLADGPLKEAFAAFAAHGAVVAARRAVATHHALLHAAAHRARLATVLC